MLISLLALPVLAGPVYEETFTEDFDDYWAFWVDDVNQYVLIEYNDLWGTPAASTSVNAANTSSGYSFVYICCFGMGAVSADSRTVDEYGYYTAAAMLSNFSFATKTQHYGNRVVNGDATAWNYYVEDPNHDYRIDSRLVNLER